MKNHLSSALTRLFATSLLACAAVLPAHAENTAPVEDFSVFVDLPTGFAFIRTPKGWHFVRQIEGSRLAELHPSTLISLISDGERVGQMLASASGR